MSNRRISNSSIVLLVMLALAILLTRGAVAQHGVASATVPIASMAPSGAIFLLTTDASWWRERLATDGQNMTTRAALARANASLGVSLEHDILPWAGQCALVGLDTTKYLLLLEIRDRATYEQTLPSLQTRLEQHLGKSWAQTSYQGVTLRYDSQSVTNIHLAWGSYGGWLVMGIGDGAIRQGIDVWRGTIPTLLQNTRWTKAVAALPADRVVLFTLHPANVLSDTTVVGSLSATDTELRFELIATPGSTAKQQLFQAFKESLTPLDHTLLTKLPAGTFAALLVSNPGRWLPGIKALLPPMCPPSARLEVMAALRAVTPALDGFAGEIAVTEHWTKPNGFGLLALYKATSRWRADLQVDRITDILASRGLTVEEKDGIAYLRLPGSASYCWTAKDDLFRFTDDAAQLSATGQTTLSLPAETKDADIVFFANLVSIPPAPDWPLQSLCSDLRVLGYGAIAPDGANAHAVLSLQTATPGKLALEAALLALRE
jgi:hypothetical protein